MGNSNSKTGFSVDRISLVISVLALAASGATLYYQFLRGPIVRAYPSETVYLSKANQIGIPVSLTNSGTAADVIDRGSLDLARGSDGPTQAFPLRWISPFEQQVSYADGKWIEAARVYLPFTDVSLKAGDTAEEVFWFEPAMGNFSFQPGRYTACLHFVSATGGSVLAEARRGQSKTGCSASLIFDLDSGQLRVLTTGAQDNLRLDVVHK